MIGTLPCPFCGHGRVLICGAKLDQPEGWRCECDACHSSGPSEAAVNEAIVSWNKVASLKLLVLDVEVCVAADLGEPNVYNELGLPLVGYAGCGSHRLEVTPEFIQRFCDREKLTVGQKVELEAAIR